MLIGGRNFKMKLLWLRKSIQDKYSQLLAIIIILFILAPHLEGTTGQILVSAVFLGTIIAIIRTFELKKKYFFELLILAGISFIFDIYHALQADFEKYKYFLLVTRVIESLFILAALFTLNRKIFLEKKVNADTIQGGISVFFLIGIFWGMLYSIVYVFDANAFSPSGETLTLFSSMFYFSFTTLTTLGYGDITPTIALTRTLANLEAVTGMMYPAIFIARLVGLYTSQQMSEGD